MDPAILIAIGLGVGVWVLFSRRAAGVAYSTGQQAYQTGSRVVSEFTGNHGVATIANGVLTGPQRTYRFTSDDKLWLGRALIGEVSENASRWSDPEVQRGGAAVAWAMAQRFVLTRGGARFATYTGLLRAYCQPINPKWEALTSTGCVSNPELCTPAHLSRRSRIRNTPWASLPAQVRSIVDSFMSGTLPNPVPGYTDWNAVTARTYTSDLPLVIIANNRFGAKVPFGGWVV